MKKDPKLTVEDLPIISPPSNLTVEGAKVILYRADDTPLTRRIGFGK